MTGWRHLTLLPSVFMRWTGVHYPCMPSHGNVTPVAQPSFMRGMLRLHKALIIDHRRLFWCSAQRVFTTTHVALYCPVSHLTPMEDIKQHNHDSHGSCGGNFLSHLPTKSLPIWNSFLCEFSRQRCSIRVLHMWSRWRTSRGSSNATSHVNCLSHRNQPKVVMTSSTLPE